MTLSNVLHQVGLSVVRYSLYGQYKGRDRDRRQGASSSRSLQRRESRKTLSVDARPFYMTGEGTSNEHLPSNVLQLGEALFPKVQNLRPVSFSQFTVVNLFENMFEYLNNDILNILVSSP